MALVGRFKIGQMTPKENFTYPVVRFPTTYAKKLIGKKVSIYETTNESGKLAYRLELDDDSMIPEKDAQRTITRGIENRLQMVEIEMKGMKKSLDSIIDLLKADAKRSKSEGKHSSKKVM